MGCNVLTSPAAPATTPAALVQAAPVAPSLTSSSSLDTPPPDIDMPTDLSRGPFALNLLAVNDVADDVVTGEPAKPVCACIVGLLGAAALLALLD